MRKTHVLGLLAVVAVAAIGFIWFTLSMSSDVGATAVAPGGIERPAAPPRSEEALASPSKPEPERERAFTAPAVEEQRARPEEGLLATVPEEELRWIEGRLLLPDGAAWDETAMALSVAAPDRQRASRALFQMITRQDQEPTRETDVLYRASFEKDGSFRVACEKDAEWAYLEIDARFLYLPEPQAVKLEGDLTRVDLAPLLGSSLKGKWSAAPDATSVEREFTGGLVYLTVLSSTDMPPFFNLGGDEGPPVFHRTYVDADGEFELRGLDPGVGWLLVSHPPQLASSVSDVPELVAGEEQELEIELVRGSRLSGRVVDRGGEPLFGARLVVSSTDEEVDFSRMKLVSRESVSRGDGSFDVYGIAPGEVRLHAEREGYRRSVRKKFELEAGSAETGILLKLRRGEALRGHVTWADGRPAANAVVEVGRDATGKPGGLATSWRTRYGVSETDAVGSFEILGLKRRATSLWAWASREDAGRWVEGVARLDGIKPSEDEEHALVLEEHLLLSGVVRDGEGRPVPEFTLLIRPDEGAGSMMGAFTAQGSETERVVSSSEGSFRLERLDEGDYSVAVEAEGFATSTPLGFRVPIDPATPPLEIVLEDFSSVSGIVVRPDGSPAAGAEVVVTRGELRAVDMMLAEVRAPAKATTNGRGEFALTQLQPGELDLTASDETWVKSAGIRLDLRPGETRSGVVVPLRVGATLSGELLDLEGRPVADRQILVRHTNVDRGDAFRGRATERANTDSRGWFELTGLVPGEVEVSTGAAGLEALEGLGYLDEDGDASGGRIRMEAMLFDEETTHIVLGGKVESPGEPIAVTGTVTRRGEPLSARVSFRPVEGRIGLKRVSSSTDADGVYEVELPFPGDYEVTVNPEAHPDESFFRRVRQVESLALDFRLPAARISGTVYNPEGEPAKDVPITLRQMGPGGGMTERYMRSLFGRQQTDESGFYEFDGLEPGTYVVGAGSSLMTLFVGAALGYGRTLSEPVRLDEDEDRGRVDIVLGSPCTLKGVVTDREGDPVNGASIFVFDITGAPVDMLSSTTSNASGRFRYEGLSPGVYTVMARTEELASPHSKPVEVREGEEAEVELGIRDGTVLVVTLLDPEGVPIPAEVGVTDDRGREVNDLYGFGAFFGGGRLGGNDSEGRRVGPVAAGGYRVTARAQGSRPVTRDLVVRGGEAELPVELRLEE